VERTDNALTSANIFQNLTWGISVFVSYLVALRLGKKISRRLLTSNMIIIMLSGVKHDVCHVSSEIVAFVVRRLGILLIAQDHAVKEPLFKVNTPRQRVFLSTIRRRRQVSPGFWITMSRNS
jgi:hypothetical protein